MATAEPMRAPPPTAADLRLTRSLITPEGVDLRLQLGDAGQRAAAFLLDTVFIVLILIVFSIMAVSAAGAAGGAAGRTGLEMVFVIWLLGAFFLRNGYFVFWELTARAATPGKRIVGLRVAARNGGRLTADAIFARNALRELETYLPATVLLARSSTAAVDGWMYLLAFIWVGIFALMPLFNRDRLRVGDIVAGTWVVRTPMRRLEADMAEPMAGHARFAFTPAQVDAYGVKELQVLEEVLRRRHRKTMTAVAERIRTKIGWTRTPDEGDEDFLGAYYAALRGKLETGLLFGRRRADKHDIGGASGA